MIDVNLLLPKLSEVYTEEGVNDAHVMAGIIEKICRELDPQEIKHFLKFIDSGRYNEAFIMFRELMSRDHISRDHIDCKS